MAVDLSAEYRKAFVIRRFKTGAMAGTCAGCGAAVVYWASASPTLGVVLAVLALIATVVLTLGVYILSEPAGESLEEYAELMMYSSASPHQSSSNP